MPAQVCPVGECVLPAGHDEQVNPHSPNLARLINYRLDQLELVLALRLSHLEKHMSDVAGTESAALADLTSAVDDLTANLGSLPQQLADAQAALADALATDASDVAARDAALAQVKENLDQAQAAANTIEGQVERIRSASPAPGAAGAATPADTGGPTVNAGEHAADGAVEIVTPAGGDQPAQVRNLAAPDQGQATDEAGNPVAEGDAQPVEENASPAQPVEGAGDGS